MIKRLFFGCAFLVLILVVVGLFLGYRYVYQPAREMMADFSGLTELDLSLPDLPERAGASGDAEQVYDPPAEGLLTADQVEAFVTVRRRVARSLEEEVDALTARRGEPPIRVGEGVDVDLGALRDRAAEWGALVSDARALQAEAIAESGRTAAEYRWVRREVYRALGADVADLGLGELVQLLRDGEVPVEIDPEAARRLAPEANRELVAPYAEELRETLPLVLLGV